MAAQPSPPSPPAPPVTAAPYSLLKNWGSNSLPPACLSTLIFALHARPLQAFPMAFSPLLMGATYLHLAGRTTDAAGITASLSGIYALLALRRKQQGAVRAKFSARGGVRGVAIALGALNCAAGTWVYMTGDREADETERIQQNRWGWSG